MLVKGMTLPVARQMVKFANLIRVAYKLETALLTLIDSKGIASGP